VGYAELLFYCVYFRILHAIADWPPVKRRKFKPQKYFEREAGVLCIAACFTKSLIGLQKQAIRSASFLEESTNRTHATKNTSSALKHSNNSHQENWARTFPFISGPKEGRWVNVFAR
jgi:hypothetical protein